MHIIHINLLYNNLNFYIVLLVFDEAMMIYNIYFINYLFIIMKNKSIEFYNM